MIVFVAVGGWDNEGYAKPLGVYATQEMAERAMKADQKDRRITYNFTEVVEYEFHE